MNNKFWLDDIKVLYENNNYLNVFPKNGYTREQQLNSVTRACLYGIILFLMFNFERYMIYSCMVVIIICIMLNKIEKMDNKKSEKRVNKILDERKKQILNNSHTKNEANNFIDNDNNLEDEIYKSPDDDSFEVGQYDSDNTLIFNKKKKKKVKTKDLYTPHELKVYKQETCRKPTKDNPFMNPSISDYNTETDPQACDIEYENVEESMNNNYHDKLYRNLDELWDLENSQRQFYTIPNSEVPNKQKEFAEFLYKVPDTCKENQQNCLRYENLKYQS